MHASFAASPVFLHCLRPVLALAAVLVSAATALAVGTISGTVSNRNTGQYLEGAEVSVVGRNERVLTMRDGSFSLGRLPAGNYTVRVTYTGLDSQTYAVVVSDDKTSPVVAELTSEIYQLEPVVIAGVREGNAASITQQRHADAVMNVVAMDAFGNVADGNIGNFLQRLPGVGAILEVGDVVGIGVRGTPPELNAVTIDGTTSAAASSTIYQAAGTQGDRAVPVDQVPSDFIKEVQLIKAPTPDMAANSIGGTANLITKSALDVKGTQLAYRFGANLNTFRSDQREWTPTASFTYLTQLGKEERVGVAVSASYTETKNGRDRIQMTRNLVADYTSQARTLDDWATRIRSAVSTKFNFRPNDSIDLYVGLAYTYYSFQQPRYDYNITATNTIADYARVSRAQIEAGTAPRTTANAAAGIAPGPSENFVELLHATFQNIASGSARHSRTYKVDAGATIDLPADQKLDLKGSFSPSKFETVFQTLNVRRVGGFGVSVDSSGDRLRPVYRQTYGTTIGLGADLTDYTAMRTVSANNNEDEVLMLKGDYEKRFEPARFKFKLKVGGSWQQQKRNEAPYTPQWNYVGADGVAGRNAATGINDDNLALFRKSTPGYGVMNNQYPLRDAFDFPGFMKFFEANRGQFRDVGTTVSVGPAFRSLQEDVYAGYAMGTAEQGPVRLVAGVRGEQSDVSAVGVNNDPRNSARVRKTSEGSYRNYFPSAHLRYEPVRGLVTRASYSTGAARAAFSDIYPNTTVTYNETTGLGSVQSATPELKPAYAENYDLSVEYYVEPAGVLSVSVFRKDIKDFIARETRVIGGGSNNGFDGLYEGFDLNTTTNAGSAKVEGYELNLMHQFVWLPKPFNTLSFFANYTKTKTQGSYASGAEELVRYVPATFNAGFSGRYKNLEARVSYNFKDGYLQSYSSTASQRVRTSGVETWDFNVQYRVNPRITLFVDVVNAFNEWESWYTGTNTARVTMAEVYGTRLNVGLSGRF
ncbi:MAG: TonB-dependent receptor [Opitutaceae bacterium]